MGFSDIMRFLKTNQKLIYTSGATIISIALAYAIGKWREGKVDKKKRITSGDNLPSNAVKHAISTIEEILTFQGPGSGDYSRIYIRNEAELQGKLNVMFQEGLESLQIITDFDRTLSKARHMGKPVPSTHGILELYPDLPEESRDKFHELRSTYMPIEFDPNLADDAKVPYMQEWWSQAHAEILKAGVQQKLLSGTVADSGINLRDGAPDFLRMSNRLAVPVLIFSAGIGNVIEEIIDQRDCAFDNIQVAANYMTFDQQGDLSGFQGQLFHTYNKTASTCSDSEFCQANVNRRNVLLLGDSTGDPKMADGAVDPSLEANVIRIGFLNVKIAESLKTYLKHYDLVLVDDQTFDIPNLLLRKLGDPETRPCPL